MLFLPATLAPAMKTIAFCLLASLLALARRPQEERDPQRSAAALFQEEAERLAQELDGSWILMEYTDPAVPDSLNEASGFATFHDGFLTWMFAVDSAEDTFFGLREFLVLESGAYRYRVDGVGNLQLAAVMSFTNNNEDGEVERDPPGIAFEYFASLTDGVLELRDAEGITITFRKVDPGEFPDSAVRQIERQRGGVESWDDGEDEEGR